MIRDACEWDGGHDVPSVCVVTWTTSAADQAAGVPEIGVTSVCAAHIRPLYARLRASDAADVETTRRRVDALERLLRARQATP